jgi:hypothetical protein
VKKSEKSVREKRVDIAREGAVYLLFWNEGWQQWPIPRIAGAFFGSIIDDFLLYSVWKRVRSLSEEREYAQQERGSGPFIGL